ncbi:hypothetical protein [Pedobacter sp. Hv1]|uniref:hypothetical protein n=1 Tax=Pedobacter sp. Hv1 TaxID=1740090 RepID=UPI0006D8C0FB|nr:hypothetical protein [Pedobacter sp. Hv1]KQC00045.1 hypothetical protein AQF98_14635 [Pedobacter sp. Hv1]
MRKVYCISILCFLNIASFAQNVASVNGKSISSKEFMWVYKKNHAGVASASYQELAAYLDLYINFKLKVIDAKGMGLDVDTAYKKEINGYEQALKAQKKASPKNIEYNFIMNEYREGVLMFNVSEKKVWSKVQDNDSQLRDFYSKYINKYDGKGFDEVKGQVIADYQQNLEDDWIRLLKLKYTVKVNDDELRKLAKL